MTLLDGEQNVRLRVHNQWYKGDAFQWGSYWTRLLIQIHSSSFKRIYLSAEEEPHFPYRRVEGGSFCLYNLAEVRQ